MAAHCRAIPFLSPSPSASVRCSPSGRRAGHLRCAAAAGQAGFFTRLGRLIKEKAKSDVDKLFSGFSKTRESLSVVDELLTYWNLADTDRALLVSDFGPKISFRIVDTLREEIRDGKLKSGAEIKEALKRCILELLTSKGGNSELQLGFRFKNEGVKVLMAAGDTFRAAARDQLEVWAERTGSEIVIDNDKKAKPESVLSQAVKRGKREEFDLVLCDTSGRLHTNYGLMEELVTCKKVIAKALPGAPNEILLVLDGTTGLNMLQQAKEFNDVVGVTGFILTKLDGTARGGCVVSVVDELGIPVKFIGVGEGLEDLQPFDAEAFVEAIFP
uniref:SRP54-type proteins GTP-binding domain-containing protein n=1 Tax=Leersia perrieri TaxID=77586 RepID=A0A0D9VAI0_9ORYZ